MRCFLRIVTRSSRTTKLNSDSPIFGYRVYKLYSSVKTLPYFRYLLFFYIFYCIYIYNFNCLNVCVHVCVRVSCQLGAHAHRTVRGEFNMWRRTLLLLLLLAGHDRTVNWKCASTAAANSQKLRRCGELQATDTCSLRTCPTKAQSQRQLASEWRCWLRTSPPCSLNISSNNKYNKQQQQSKSAFMKEM